MHLRAVFIVSFFLYVGFYPSHSFSAPASPEQINSLLDRECTNLKKDKLFSLIKTGFSSEIEKGLSAELLKIMEGVVKRTDFDGIKEDKTAEIIRLVYEAYKKGAPLPYLDLIFDVAYAKTVSVDQLYAAANALKEFDNSSVPPEIYEEFIYRSIEGKWEPAAVPVLARGLIYGIDRGLTPQRVALSIMIDMEKGELEKKAADQLVLDAIKMVRDMEPEKWKPLNDTEKALAEKRAKKAGLERVKKDAEARKAEKETEIQKAQAELKKADKRPDEKELASLEKRIKTAQAGALKYQKDMTDVGDVIQSLMEEIERKEEEKRTALTDKKKKELDIVKQKVEKFGLSGAPDMHRLSAAVNKYIGIPYRYGGDSESGIDCSAFTRRVYRELGTELPRTAREQAAVGNTVNNNSVVPGDLVFFDTSISGNITHVGVFLDTDTFAHASKSQGVTRSSIKERYYSKRFLKSNRIFGNAPISLE